MAYHGRLVTNCMVQVVKTNLSCDELLPLCGTLNASEPRWSAIRSTELHRLLLWAFGDSKFGNMVNSR
jgi:hypothetical protein